ncbi:Tetratricopeptide repeat-containing protein [Micromonospora matsumotoense]|uniref:Tetratricopeptide repeat-containing protein n=1 Tax=Micromonospora matsumotoense TaxID=121616 RepID=A0A1C4YST8_9ACTN|nr:FxSxx-COOH system tetratricopeptide repeat protein [Micromonospora matsumotoense]SCF23401.1 Tetratricopeptide repeat-containing protein [Micromonospora matsumotoense]
MQTEGHGTSAGVGSGLQINNFINTSGVPAPRPAADQPAVAADRPSPVWNLLPRDPNFAGRGSELAELRTRLSSGGAAGVQAIHGLGGVGKTQLALEYAHRHRADYDVVWWISAEQSGAIGEQFSALGIALGVLDAQVDSVIAQSKVKEYLRSRNRWLLIFDNAEKPEDLRPWLPDGAGHMLVTSRTRNWGQLARTLELDILPRAEAVELLTLRLTRISVTEAGQLAEDLGDLPLALAQAASYLAEFGMSVTDYRQVLREETRAVLDEGQPAGYPHSLAAAATLSTSALGARDPAALAVLHLCAFLAPEPVPTDLVVTIARHADLQLEILAPLAQIIDKLLQRQRAISAVGASGLARVELGTITVHRLVQAIVRDQVDPAVAAELRARIEAALGTVDPGNPRDTATWPQWSMILPHLLAADPAHTDNAELRLRTRDAIVYLLCRGDSRPAQQLADNLYQAWKERHGPDDLDTLRAATELVWAYRDLGQFDRLRPLIDDTLTRQINILGHDHPDTLRTASDLAVVHSELGNYQRAREIDEDVYRRRVRLLGEDHPDTLMSATNLIITIADAGEPRRGLKVAEDVHRRAVRVLGEDHPNTLAATNNLSNVLGAVGDLRRALEVAADVYRRRLRVLGEEHPDTLRSMVNLVRMMVLRGQLIPARRMAESAHRKLRTTLGGQHPNTREARTVLDQIAAAMGGRQSTGKARRHR